MRDNAICGIVSVSCFKIIDMTRKFIPPNLDDLISKYRAGTSEKQLSGELGVSRNVIRRILVSNGIQPRTKSEAEAVKWAAMTPDARASQVAAAHAASRGRNHRISHRESIALAREQRGIDLASPLELRLSAMLAQRGIGVVHQKAVGPYNCDLTAGSVAVEVFGGNWHFSGSHLARAEKRCRYLFDRGWHILIIIHTSADPIGPGAADYVSAFLDEAGRDPSGVRQYRMVGGGGELLAACGADSDQIPHVPPFAHARDPITGRYMSVPR